MAVKFNLSIKYVMFQVHFSKKFIVFLKIPRVPLNELYCQCHTSIDCRFRLHYYYQSINKYADWAELYLELKIKSKKSKAYNG